MSGREGIGQVLRDDDELALVAANLTPDNETGIGGWTDDMLARAIREGIGHDGRYLSPAMPYRNFASLPDEDLAAVIVYLRSRPPVKNPLPKSSLPEARLAKLERQWQPLKRPVHPPAPDALSRGRHLIELGKCNSCHTPWSAPRFAGQLAGGDRLQWEGEEVFSTNLTPHPTGVAYGAEAFRTIIRTGKGGTLSPAMPWISFKNLDDHDLDAIHAALATAWPVDHAVGSRGPKEPCEVCGQDHPLGSQNRLELPEPVAIASEELARCAGTYRSEEEGFELEITVDDDTLVARWDEEAESTFRAIPIGEGRYVLPGDFAPIACVTGSTKAEDQILSLDLNRLRLNRVPGE